MVKVAAFLSLAVGSASMVDAGACKPVTMLMTRASGSFAKIKNGNWSTEFGLSTVNTANIEGSLKFIMTETIDSETGYTNTEQDGCHRKNHVAYIHFYQMTVCNSDAALWWFNYRDGGVWGDEAKYNYGEYGQYLTMDEGRCHDSRYCNTFHGGQDTPNLGPFVGWQDVSTDPRNPTKNAYWYSLPGECPKHVWKVKTDECNDAHPSGRCPDGVVPDGETCTWSYRMLGQVALDDMVGITKQINPETGKAFKDAEEFCLAGNFEFKRDPDTYDFIEGLPFWQKPLDEEANAERVEILLKTYAEDSSNIPLPSIASLKASNPPCYTSTPGCFDGTKSTCVRDDSMLCVSCDSSTCETVSDATLAFPTSLPAVTFDGKNTDTSGFIDTIVDPVDQATFLAVCATTLFLSFTLAFRL